jgi:hypothetical protein
MSYEFSNFSEGKIDLITEKFVSVEERMLNTLNYFRINESINKGSKDLFSSIAIFLNKLQVRQSLFGS